MKKGNTGDRRDGAGAKIELGEALVMSCMGLSMAESGESSHP